jgi:spore germination protein GerM
MAGPLRRPHGGRAALAAGAALLAGLLPVLSACGGHKDDADTGTTDSAASAAGAPPQAGGSSVDAQPVPAAAVPLTEAENRREVVLFFQRSDDDMLGPEKRMILPGTTVIDQGKQVIAELIAGPRTRGLLPTIPERTTVLGLYLDKSGTAYLDLSVEFVSDRQEGSSEELATVFSVVDSLTYNLPEVKRVRFLVGGEERETLQSHLDLRRAWLKDMSIVRMDDAP